MKPVEEKEFIYYKHKRLIYSVLQKLKDTPCSIVMDGEKIVKVFLYNDGTNPLNDNKKSLYKSYFEKLEILSKLKVQ